MMTVDEIKSAIEALEEEDFALLLDWISECNWQKWDQELEADIQAGKLDFLAEEALRDLQEGRVKEL